MQCVNCGAPLTIQEYTSASKCEHCGCYIVFNERIEGVYEPHMLLPFRINKKAAAQALDSEFSRRLFTPSDFLSAKSLESMEGIYVPFWMYDYRAFYDFAGEGMKLENNESDVERLKEYYRHGYEVSEEKKEELRDFLREQ